MTTTQTPAKPRYRTPSASCYVNVSLDEFDNSDIVAYLKHEGYQVNGENSNDVGQVGSLWEHVKPFVPQARELTDAEIVSLAYDCNALPEVITDKTLLIFARAVLAARGTCYCSGRRTF